MMAGSARAGKRFSHRIIDARSPSLERRASKSLQPQPMTPDPVETADIVRTAFPRGNRYMRNRDTLGSLSNDKLFVAPFPGRGQPALAPWRLALVTVMQFAEGRSDRQEADAVAAGSTGTMR